MSSFEEKFTEELLKLKDSISEDDKLLATELLIQYGTLSSRLMAGEDVEDKLEGVKIAMTNVQVGVASNLADRARALAFEFLTKLISKIV